MALVGKMGRWEAQGGIGAWTPADIAGIYAFYLADNVDIISSEVDRFYDLSGNGRDLPAAGPSVRPSYDATHAPGSNPAVLFDGSSDYMSATSGAWGTLASPLTMFFVTRSNVNGDNVFADSSSNVNSVYALNFTGNFALGDSIINRGYQAVDMTAYHLHEIYFEPGASLVRYDGVVKGFTALSFGDTRGLTGLNIGINRQLSYEFRWGGYVAAFGVVDGVISSGDRTLLQSYIASKYTGIF